MNRRSFIRLSGISGGGLLLSAMVPAKAFGKQTGEVWRPNYCIQITPDNVVTLISKQLEIGQGITTGLGQLVADELGVDWDQMVIETTPGNAKELGLWEGTGGSNGLAGNWDPLRKAAAATREVLIEAAATKWGVSKDQCITQKSQVVHKSTNKSLSFGELASEAAKLTLPENPRVKSKGEYEFIGKSIIGPKQRKIVTGTNGYSIDIRIPDMVYASIERTPVFLGKVIGFDATEAMKTKGVLDIYSYEGTPQSRQNGYMGGARAGVVVVATSTWAAIQARKKLSIDWDFGKNEERDGEDTAKDMFEAAAGMTNSTNVEGDMSALSQDEKVKTFSYVNGFQSNICMEPLNAVADVTADKVEIWVGTQAPGLEQVRLSELLGIPQDKITVHTQPAGGGFGRRFFCDYTEEAALISKRIGKPVKLMWTREDTVRTNRYHHMQVEQWTGAMDAQNKITTVDYKGHQTSTNDYRPLLYDFPNKGMSRLLPKRSVNGHVSWRSVRAHPWILGLESFMDEMAHEAKIDPLQFRLNHLDEGKVYGEHLRPGRLADCLRLVGEKGNWGRKMKRNSGQGIAACGYNKSYCALMAEVTVKKDRFTVDKIVVAIDCGMAINPSQVIAQVEGSVVWGLAALHTEITIKGGRTEQSNYDNYPIPRMGELPEIETHIIENEHSPTGTGEPAVPVTAPAVLNAIFAASGKRIRRIPIGLREV